MAYAPVATPTDGALAQDFSAALVTERKGSWNGLWGTGQTWGQSRERSAVSRTSRATVPSTSMTRSR